MHTTQRAEALSLYRDELGRCISGADSAAHTGKGKSKGESQSKAPPDVHPPDALQV
jgi:hypothetical protein